MISTDSRCKEKKLPPELYAQLDVYIESLHITDDNPRRKEMLIQTLRKAQSIFGYLPEEVQLHSDRISVSIAGCFGFCEKRWSRLSHRPKMGICPSESKPGKVCHL